MTSVRDETAAPVRAENAASVAGDARPAAPSGGLRGALPLIIRLTISAALLAFLFAKVPLADVLALGANVWRGDIVCQGVAESLGLPWRPLAEVI